MSETTFQPSDVNALPCVLDVQKIQSKYPLLARLNPQTLYGFEYQGLEFSQDSFHLFAGLNAVDSPTHVRATLQALERHGLHCTRMGVYKPRTNPYGFQGLGDPCLPYVFEMAGEYGIRVIAMEITRADQIDTIDTLLDQAGRPTGVLLQVGTRNAQNFELLKSLGQQTRYPILYKRGYGITLEESLQAAEYIAAEGNRNIVFCLRGMKSHFSDPHRNFVDTAHIPVIKRQTRMPVCLDPSHAIGLNLTDPHGIMDIFHAAVQGVIAGANALLVDVHPNPQIAPLDATQALPLQKLGWFLKEVELARRCWNERKALAMTTISP